MKSKLFVLGILMMLFSMTLASAFTTLSLDKISFDSNNDDLKGEAFVLFGVENGGLQSATFDIQDLESSLPSDYAMDGTGTITSSLTNYRLTYPLEVSGTFYKFQQVCEADGDCTYFSTVFNPSSAEWCSGLISSDAVSYVTVKDYGEANYKCLEIIPVGKYADIQSPTTRFTDTIKVTANGKTETVALTETNTVDSTSNVIASIEGNLVTFQSEPEPENKVAGYFNPSTNKWNLITSMSATEQRYYLSSSTLFQDFSDCWNYELLDWKQCMEQVNDAVDDKLSATSYSNSKISGTTSSNGELVLTPTTGTYYKIPVFTLTIDADFVGIYKPVGEPNIIDINAESKYIEGNSIVFTSEVENKAEVDASFVYTWNCNGGDIDTLTAVSFDAGETQTISHVFHAETSEGCSDVSCTLTVKDKEYPDSQDSMRVEFQVCEVNQCTELGEQRCLGSTVQECVEENGVQVWDSIRTCPTSYTCRVDGGYGVCAGDDANVEPTCGDGICEAGEQQYGDFECIADCPLPTTTTGGTNAVVIVSVLGGVGLLGAIGLRLKKEGYFKK